jgi:hypothetical protein
MTRSMTLSTVLAILVVVGSAWWARDSAADAPKKAKVESCADELARTKAELARAREELKQARAESAELKRKEQARAKRLEDSLGGKPMIENLR